MSIIQKQPILPDSSTEADFISALTIATVILLSGICIVGEYANTNLFVTTYVHHQVHTLPKKYIHRKVSATYAVFCVLWICTSLAPKYIWNFSII